MIRRYITLYVFIIPFFLGINFFVLSSPEQLHLHDFGGFFLLDKSLEEGFCAGTLVKTPYL